MRRVATYPGDETWSGRGRHVVDLKLGLGLEELYFGRIRPEGGQLDGDCCERDLAIRV